ncbi:MAG: histidine phosphatase family protein [Chloroflexi bacterium]|nr:histidine phosphatase family protein [Chloroflexota bacterium]
MNLILVRHGETRYNLEGRAIGLNPVELDAKGRQQAKRAAEALASLAPVALYTSPLPRALETATIISQRLGIEACPRDNLREANIGLLDGLTQDEMWQQYPDFMQTWYQDASTVVMPGGESILQVQERAWNTIEEIKDRHPDGNVAVVSHSFTLLGLVCKLLGMPLSNFHRLRLNLASITQVEINQEKATLVRYNDQCHLDGLP